MIHEMRILTVDSETSHRSSKRTDLLHSETIKLVKDCSTTLGKGDWVWRAEDGKGDKGDKKITVGQKSQDTHLNVDALATNGVQDIVYLIKAPSTCLNRNRRSFQYVPFGDWGRVVAAYGDTIHKLRSLVCVNYVPSTDLYFSSGRLKMPLLTPTQKCTDNPIVKCSPFGHLLTVVDVPYDIVFNTPVVDMSKSQLTETIKAGYFAIRANTKQLEDHLVNFDY